MHKLTLATLRVALAAALCSALAAQAATTQIAQVPLLNITGTGTVKPNLMLLFDNSGSMDQTYTPDYVNDNLCRSGATLAAGAIACNVGHPPFMSPDFNKQYYNPTIRYTVPIKADGTYYPEQNASNTTNWTSVSGDGYGVHKADLFGNTVTSNIDLTTAYPDLKWCDPNNSSSCKTNSATYTYPDATYKNAVAITGGPYYYTIGVAQYCTDDTMKTCTSTSVGAAAPAGYPVPVKVRWCTNTLLTDCQGKRVGTYIYPSYSAATGAMASYGTISIGATTGAGSLSITTVTIPDPTTARTITNGTVTASTGLNTTLKQQTLASALAASIIAKTGLTNQYYACVKTPTGQPTVPACSTFGITLSADNIVAVVPVTCVGTKSVANCATVTDSSRAGWGITVAATLPVPPTAIITVSGTTANSGTPKVSTVTLAGVTLASNISLGTNKSSSNTASTIVTAINASSTAGTVKAYVGGNSVTPTCAAASSSSICLVDSAATANGAAPAISAVTNLSYTLGNGAGYAEGLTASTAALSTGSGTPSTFARVNLVSGQTYPKAATRTDCAGSTCTYTEEMNNFANWYVYYKSRLQMMKTSVGVAFSTLTGNYKVGYVKLSNAGAGSAIDLKPTDFTGTGRTSWYAALYNTTTSGSTPIRTAMDNVGRMYANLTPYNYAAGQEVVQYPCQPNFMILTTDGYWNGTSTANVVNNDNVENPSRFCTIASGCVDKRAQTQPSISDVALHWYNGGSSTSTVSLRPSLEDMTKAGSVPAGDGENTHLHMTTYTLGLGVDGVMTYEPKYDTAPKAGGDFYNLITAATSGCPWNGGGAYVWPDPDVTNTASTVQERVDDLWHAAINGHGKYFSAQSPKDVVAGLSEALTNMQVHSGAAAAAATSTPNISLQDNDIFADTFTTVKWYGELTNRKIDTTNGKVSDTVSWSTTDILGKSVSPDSSGRKIYMFSSNGTTPRSFYYSQMTTEKAWFDNKCSMLSQCALLSAADKATANTGANLVNWLRGEQTYADNNIFRAYTMTPTVVGGPASIPIVLGDIASAKPAFVRDPRNDYPDAAYTTFKAKYSDLSNRIGTVLTAANDNMLHAFSATDGSELWAYVPRIAMMKMYALASTTYGTNHQYYTDGSPEVADVKDGANWKTIMVAGMNAGGRGYYALDVTDTKNPLSLWEFCADATVCPLNNDPDMGLTFGNPQIGTWKGKWVVFVTSGYNNVPGTDGVNSGSGVGYLYILDAMTGALLKKISTGSGSVTTPSGLAKITAISNDPNSDPAVTYVYGGDNQGQMWRFDLTDPAGAVSVVKMGDAGVLQPITTRPDVTLCGVPVTTVTNGTSVTTTTTARVVLFGTGRLLDIPDTTNTDVQSLYLLKDSGSTISNVRGTTMVQQTLSLTGSGSNGATYAITSNPVDLTQRDGWYFDWKLNAGERMNLDPQIVSGVANVVTNLPSSSSACTVGGSSNYYQVNICTGQAVNGNPAGATLSTRTADVGFIIIRLPKGQLKMIATLADGSTTTTSVTEAVSAQAHRAGWRRVKGE